MSEHTSEITEKHLPCPDCMSSDALCKYDDGHTFCYSCGKNTPASQVPKEEEDDGDLPLHPIRDNQSEKAKDEPKPKRGFVSFKPADMKKRRLKKATLEKLGYGWGDFKGKRVQVAGYTDAWGNLSGQKIRFQNKDFLWFGEGEQRLFGQHAWKEGGELVVITEGEIDALSVAQAGKMRIPAVSVRNGSSGAREDLTKQLEWLESFKNIVLCFDMDGPGQKAVQECATLFSPNKCHIAQLPLKDANDMLVEEREDELMDAIMNAKTYRPDGLVSGERVWDEITRENDVPHIPYPWSDLQEKTLGIRGGEIVTLCAGSGIGKSAVCKELAYWLRLNGQRLGYIALEESVKRTALGLMGVHMNRPLWLYTPEEMPEPEEMREAFDEVIGDGDVTLYDHFGSMDGDNLLAKVRFMVKACGAPYIFLDHLSIVVSGMEDGDERRRIDNIMTSLRSLVEETGCALILVSHLKRPEGKGHEDGARTSLAQLRGSAGIAQLSDIVIGLERDQQDPDTREITTMRILKNRFTGICGETTALRYSSLTGRLKEVDDFIPMGAPSDDSDDDEAPELDL